jgi:zinc transport system substrate-binding protein
MRKILFFLVPVLIISCGRNDRDQGNKIITVSIAPFKYFVEEIAGNDFTVNIMVPAGADPHTYEPFPEQINKLRKSVGYISNGYLGFEMNWLDRFYETNRTMKKLSLSDGISPLASEHHHEGGHLEGADPHYWVSPNCAKVIAGSVEKFLIGLNPLQRQKYETNYQILLSKIQDVDTRARELLSNTASKGFMIYHPNLAYIARDYGLEEIPVEFEGKEPTPMRMKELIDRARKDNMKTIFVQVEYDTKNARAIAGEIGGKIILIDPLSENWQKSTMDIINALHASLVENSK